MQYAPLAVATTIGQKTVEHLVSRRLTSGTKCHYTQCAPLFLLTTIKTTFKTRGEKKPPGVEPLGGEAYLTSDSALVKCLIIFVAEKDTFQHSALFRSSLLDLLSIGLLASFSVPPDLF
jgi:hypothetical protein